MKKAIRWALALGGCSLGIAYSAPSTVAVNVVVDMTEAGRKLAPPTKEKPVYYYPVVGGYREEGSLVAGEKAPPKTMVIRELARALSVQGYLVVGPKTPPPSLLIVLHWGYMNPLIDTLNQPNPSADTVNLPENPQKIFFNQTEMLALVGGNTLPNIDLSFQREEVMQGAAEDRYFIIVTAFDWTAAATQKKKVPLWSAKLSVPSNRVTLAEVIPALARAGATAFGHETKLPQQVTEPYGREGKVEVGTPSVVPDKK